MWCSMWYSMFQYMKLNTGFNFTDLVDILWSFSFSGNPQCCVIPQTIFSVAKNFGTKNNSMGNSDHVIYDHTIMLIHMATNILDDNTHFHLSRSGIASSITLVLMPSACCIISTYKLLCIVRKALPGTNINKNPNKLGFANIWLSDSKSCGSVDPV